MQTVINQYQPAAFNGMLDGIAEHFVRSYAAEEAIPMGYAVMLGTNKDKQVKKTTSGALTIGFSIHDQVRTQDSNGLVQYAIKEAVSVLTRGRLWVLTAKAVTAGATANLVVASGLFTDAAVGGGTEAITQRRVTFITSTTAANQLAIIAVS